MACFSPRATIFGPQGLRLWENSSNRTSPFRGGGWSGPTITAGPVSVVENWPQSTWFCSPSSTLPVARVSHTLAGSRQRLRPIRPQAHTCP